MPSQMNPNVIPGVGRLLRQRRDDAGMTQAALGEAVGLTQGAILHLETDRRAPSLRVLVAIADTLGCRVDDLIPARKINLKKNTPGIDKG